MGCCSFIENCVQKAQGTSFLMLEQCLPLRVLSVYIPYRGSHLSDHGAMDVLR